jgi:hypothetical protein
VLPLLLGDVALQGLERRGIGGHGPSRQACAESQRMRKVSPGGIVDAVGPTCYPSSEG